MSENASSRAWSWRHAIQKSSLQPTTKLILYNLSLYMNEQGGSCFPSVETQAEDTGLDPKTVQRHLKKARDAGWIRVEARHFPKHEWRKHTYFASWPERGGTESPPTPKEIVQDDGVTGDSGYLELGAQSPPIESPKNLSKDSLSSPDGEDDSDSPLDSLSFGVETDSFGPASSRLGSPCARGGPDSAGEAKAEAASPGASGKPECHAAIDAYNALAARIGLTRVQARNERRMSQLRNRLRDAGGLHGWLLALEKVEASPFLRGEKTDWKADFDFLLQKKSFTKLLEGGYDDAGKKSGFADSVRNIMRWAEDAERKNPTGGA